MKIQAAYTGTRKTGNHDRGTISQQKARSAHRWKALMTTVHEIMHTVAHPRYRKLINSAQIVEQEIGTEGGTEYVAIPIKESLRDRIKPDDEFAASVVGSTDRSARNIDFSLAGDKGYEDEVGGIEKLVADLGGGGRENFNMAFFRGWVEFIGYEGDADSKPFRGKKFTTPELDTFLTGAEPDSPKKGLYADDKARAIVDGWRRGLDPEQGSSHFDLSPEDKGALINQMLRGITGNPDEKAILAVLGAASPEEWTTLFGDDPLVDRRRLVRKFQGQRKHLAAVLDAKFGISLRTFKDEGLP